MEKYSERFNDIVILQLDTEGFENLTNKQKQLAYYLSKAGLWGRAISTDQGSEHNIPLFNSFIDLLHKDNLPKDLFTQIHDSLFIMFSHNGIYHSTSGELLTFPLQLSTLESFYHQEPLIVDTIKSIWFSNIIPQFRTVQTDGVDVIAKSGGNFYKNLTTEEVNSFRNETYPKTEGDEIPPFGFNERLVKNEEGVISRQVISENGLYGNYVKEIIQNLSKALDFTENEKQYSSIKTTVK